MDGHKSESETSSGDRRINYTLSNSPRMMSSQTDRDPSCDPSEPSRMPSQPMPGTPGFMGPINVPVAPRAWYNSASSQTRDQNHMHPDFLRPQSTGRRDSPRFDHTWAFEQPDPDTQFNYRSTGPALRHVDPLPSAQRSGSMRFGHMGPLRNYSGPSARVIRPSNNDWSRHSHVHERSRDGIGIANGQAARGSTHTTMSYGLRDPNPVTSRHHRHRGRDQELRRDNENDFESNFRKSACRAVVEDTLKILQRLSLDSCRGRQGTMLSVTLEEKLILILNSEALPSMHGRFRCPGFH